MPHAPLLFLLQQAVLFLVWFVHSLLQSLQKVGNRMDEATWQHMELHAK